MTESACPDDDDHEQCPLLMRSVTTGAKCIVAGDSSAVIMCRRQHPLCCLHSNVELLSIPDGSVVEIMQPEMKFLGWMRVENVVGVRVLSSVNTDLHGILGAIRVHWLQAYSDFISAIRSDHTSKDSLLGHESFVIGSKSFQKDAKSGNVSMTKQPGQETDTEADLDNGTVPEQCRKISDFDSILSRIGIDPETGPITMNRILSQLTEAEHEFNGDHVRSVTETLFSSASIEIDHVRVRHRKMTVRLRQRKTVTLATAPGFILDNGRLTRRSVQSRRLALREEIEIDLGDGGCIASIRHGDINVVKGPVSIGVKIRTERHPGRVDVDDKGRSIIDVDQDGMAIRDPNGEYRLKRYDDWIVVSALGRTHWIGVGPLMHRTKS